TESKAIYRGGGSIGIIGAARSAMVVGHDPEDPKRLVLAMNKINIAPKPRSLIYSLEEGDDVARIGWGEECELTADEELAQPAQQRASKAVKEAEDFLTDMLTSGPATAKQIEAKAAAKGIKDSTLQRAKKKLGVESFKAGFSGASWSWRLPFEGGQ